MKTTLLLLFSATLSFAEVAPVPVEPLPAPTEKHAETAASAKPVPAPVDEHAETAETAEPVPAEPAPEPATAPEPVPAPAEKHAETAETAEPVPAPVEKRAKPVKVNCVNRDNPANGVTGVNCANQTRPPCRILRGAPCFAKPPVCPAACVNRFNRANRANGVNGANPEKPRLGATVRLSDGSVLKGTLRRRFLPADTDALGRLRIDLAAVESIAFLPTSGVNPAGLDRLDRLGSQAAQVQQVQSVQPAHDCRITFRNGDRLTVRFPADLKPLRFDTVLGPVPLLLSAVSKLALEPPNHLTTQPPNLLYHCTFDDAQSIARPAAGPAGKFLGGTFVPGKNGKALRVEADTPAFESMLPKGFLGPEGCLEFWAKIEGDNPRYVDGGDPLFVSLYDERGAITLLQFAANNGFARGGLGGAFVSWPFGTVPHYSWSMEYRKVLGENWADWHHYAMSWKAGGFGDGSFAKVFIDGRPQPVLGGVDDDKLPARLADYANHAHELGIPWSAARAADHRRSKKPFLVDDLKIWSVAKTDFAGSSAQSPSRPTTEPPKLLYHCTFDNAQSVEHPVAGPSGKVLDGSFVPGKKGKALRIPGNVPTALVDLPRGFLQPKGTIEFWSKIEDPPASYGDRGNPRFFGLSLFDDPANPGPCSTYLQFTSNDGMGMSGLCGMIYHRAMATDPQMSTHTYGPLLTDPAAWHHYAIVWDSDGLPFSKASDGTPAVATIILDGRVLQTFGRNQFDKGKGLLRLPELQGKIAFPVEDTGWGYFARPVVFLIDEFKIWSVVRTDFIVPSTQPSKRPVIKPPKLLYHCTFDDASAIEHPATGPVGTFLGGAFEEGKIGNALRVRKGLSSAIVHFDKGVLQPRGAIEFWAKIENDRDHFGDGGDPRFFMMETVPGSETVFQLAANDGCGRGGLSIYHQGLSAASEDHCLYPAAYDSVLSGQTKGWHHYALVWDESGIPGLDGSVALAAFIDGTRIPLHGDTGLAKAPRMAARFRENPATLFFSLNPELNRGFNNKTDFLIDDFKIWNFPKTDFDVSSTPPKKLLYHCTFDDVSAIEHPAAGPAGNFLGGEFVPGKEGNALRSPGDVPVAEVDLPRGTVQSSGTIEFWAKIEEPPAFYGDRGNPLLFGLWLFDNSADPGLCSTHLGFCANNGMGMAGLCGMVYHRAMATDPHMRTNTYGPLLGDPAAWHHYAIVWDSAGLPFSKAADGTPAVATIVLDGRVLQTYGRNELAHGKGLLRLPTMQGKLAFPVPAARWGAPANHVPFLIDEFKIWSGPKTIFDLS